LSSASRVSVAAALALALAVSAAPAAAAGYIKFDGVDGEAAKSSDKPRLAVLEVQAWSWGAKDGAKGGNVEFEWKVEEGESAPPRPGGAQDIAAPAPAAAAASGTPTGKRQHKPLTIVKEVDKATPKLAEAAVKGKLFVMVPAGTCVAGARYATAEFGTGTRVYKLEDVVVASCSPAVSGGGDARPMESLSLNYERIR
jgi:type VI protein secretion system component Hcp